MGAGRSVLLVAVFAVTTVAAAESLGTLAGTGVVLRWQGGPFANAALPRPEGCSNLAVEGSSGTTCDERRLAVSVAEGFWNDLAGGLEISIQWEDEAEDLDLYVYGPDDDQKLAAASTGFGSRAESVLISAPANGEYRIVVVPASASDTTYDGLAEFETTFPTEQGDLLPNLVPLPPRKFHFAVGAYTLTPFDSRGEGRVTCYPEEQADGARKCLRFDAGVENEGPGRFEIQIDLGSLAEERRVEQAIQRSDGERRFCPAGRYTVHPFHGHVHYREFARYEIFPAGGGAPTKSRKAGFCLIDVEHRRFEAGGPTQGNEPRRGAFPDCNLPSEFDDSERKAAMVQGISRGWADVYAWALPGQFIEVSDLPDGTYDVMVTANPNCAILETRYDDNAACTRVVISDDGATVEEVGPISCPGSPSSCAEQGSPVCTVPSGLEDSGPLDVSLPGLP